MDGPASLPKSPGSSDGEGDGATAPRDGLELNPFDGLPFSSRYYKLLKERAALPIWREKYPFLERLLRDQVVIVSGDSRSGKSSQIPQWCAEFCLAEGAEAGSVVCAQVHPQAAVALALRAADEMDVGLGQEVGYAVPFDNCCSSETILRYCTAEVLQREMRSLPLLSRYAVVVLDDVHLRSAATDVLLGLLRGVLRARPRLRLVLLLAASPALPAELRAFYGPGPVLEVSARRPPARVVYHSDAPDDPVGCAARLLFDIHRTGESGHVVVFLACEQDIRRAYEIICEEGSRLGPEAGELVAVPLYPREKFAMLRPNEDPEEGFQAPRRKVVLTTSSGEALIGPDAFRFVIDVGLERRKVYNPWIRASTWTTQPISEARAQERRCIPTAPAGQVFCLYSQEWSRRHMQPLAPVQLQECNLTGTVLFLKRMDIAGLGRCDLITKPAPASLMQALEDLDYLAALDDDGNLSEFGIIMSEFPLEPQLAKALLASCEFDCLSEMLTVAAMVTDGPGRGRSGELPDADPPAGGPAAPDVRLPPRPRRARVGGLPPVRPVGPQLHPRRLGRHPGALGAADAAVLLQQPAAQREQGPPPPGRRPAGGPRRAGPDPRGPGRTPLQRPVTPGHVAAAAGTGRGPRPFAETVTDGTVVVGKWVRKNSRRER
ncbi:putative pre-mRNA-splicing factor ATP-dependent RNA helicase DHX32 isoform X2 [Tachyglossus aculeatus]|uniref:putative pre-mRNA-splicing factor ATP-dependent RNA helicase DHX32 isoform X2 n=1 Tax=Tachyglossus aculeatus TaxID=9261 RepID=UPI0018F2D153|nr:putative pre-mRNA-splicing factor ATP-dependent RNA helicase DHX32 isoform X2 [Tachyglossus aculeatus]